MMYTITHKLGQQSVVTFNIYVQLTQLFVMHDVVGIVV